MAQTIAVQRGTTTSTSDGTSRVTLFTQSSGIATRVILVGLSVNLSGTDTRLAMSLTVNVNGSGSYLPIAYITSNNNTTSRYLNMYPNGSSNHSGAIFAGSATGGGVSQSAASTVLSNLSGGTSATANPFGIQIALPFNNTNTGGSDPINYVPSQFWIGNGDLITFQCYTLNPLSASIVYHFVTITES